MGDYESNSEQLKILFRHKRKIPTFFNSSDGFKTLVAVQLQKSRAKIDNFCRPNSMLALADNFVNR